MNEPSSISIESLPQLRELLSNSCLDVVWSVRCEIGPDWIGGSREMQLLHDGNRLSGSLSDKLISAIITAASIPGESPDSVISGEGEVSIQAEKLMLDFEWTAAVPYDYPHERGHGMVELSMG